MSKSPLRSGTLPGITPDAGLRPQNPALTSTDGSIGATVVIRRRIGFFHSLSGRLRLLLAQRDIALQSLGQPRLPLLRLGLLVTHGGVFGNAGRDVKRRGCAREPPVACVRPPEGALVRCRSSVVEHSLGKGEVGSSILPGSTIHSKPWNSVSPYMGYIRRVLPEAIMVMISPASAAEQKSSAIQRSITREMARRNRKAPK